MKKRDKFGKFIKNNSIEIPIPSINFIIKNAALLLILLPWIYLAFYKFQLINLIE